MNIESLYEGYSRDVFRFALYLSGNWQDAEDITAETFVRAWVAEDSIGLATVKGYLS
jgi:DNA-directed RNA polymerase specialized sigma24 family protein